MWVAGTQKGLYTMVFLGEKPLIVKSVTSKENPSTLDVIRVGDLGVSAGKAIFQSGTREGKSQEIRAGTGMDARINLGTGQT